MNVTSKSRYAIKIMMDLAVHADEPHVHRRDIAQRQGIPSDYLDQIMMRLRRGGLVGSVRGRGGGYRLVKKPDEISIWDMFSCVEDSVYPVECLDADSSCEFELGCSAKSAWDIIMSSMKVNLNNMHLSDLVAREPKKHEACPAAGVRECKQMKHSPRASKGIKKVPATEASLS